MTNLLDLNPKVKGRFSIALSKDVIERAGLKKGDSLFVEYDRRTDLIEIERKTNIFPFS